MASEFELDDVGKDDEDEEEEDDDDEEEEEDEEDDEEDEEVEEVEEEETVEDEFLKEGEDVVVVEATKLDTPLIFSLLSPYLIFYPGNVLMLLLVFEVFTVVDYIS